MSKEYRDLLTKAAAPADHEELEQKARGRGLISGGSLAAGAAMYKRSKRHFKPGFGLRRADSRRQLTRINAARTYLRDRQQR